jgi:glyoxylase I family protein
MLCFPQWYLVHQKTHFYFKGEFPVKTPGLSHIILTVSDFDKTRKFYGDLLGFTIHEVPIPGSTLLYFEIGDASVWFFRHDQTPQGDRFSEFRIGLDHLAFKATNVPELQAMADKLIAAGVDTKGVETFPTGHKYIAFRDPDNIQLEYWLDEIPQSTPPQA